MNAAARHTCSPLLALWLAGFTLGLDARVVRQDDRSQCGEGGYGPCQFGVLGQGPCQGGPEQPSHVERTLAVIRQPKASTKTI